MYVPPELLQSGIKCRKNRACPCRLSKKPLPVVWVVILRMGMAMRGDDEICGGLFSYIDLETGMPHNGNKRRARIDSRAGGVAESEASLRTNAGRTNAAANLRGNDG